MPKKFPVFDRSQNFIIVNFSFTLHVSIDVRHHKAFSTNPQEQGKFYYLSEIANIKRHILTYLLTYLLTYSMEQSPSWEADRFSASQEIPNIYGTRRFITAFTSVHHLSLSAASSIQSIPPHPTSWRSTWILSSHLRLGLPSL